MALFRPRDWPPFRLLPFLEATLLPAAAVAGQLYIGGLYGHFGLWLPLLLVALRYGIGFALYGGLIFGSGMALVGVPWTALDWMAGSLMVGTAAWIGDHYLAELDRLRRRCRLTEGHMEGLLAQLYVTSAVSKTLQSHLLVQEATLLSAVERWIGKVAEGDGEEALWSELLDLALPIAHLHVCGLFRYLPEAFRFEPEPIAHHGAIGRLKLQDPLIVRLTEMPTRAFYLTVNDLLEEGGSAYLAAIPIRWQEELLGALVIRDMPARQITEPNLKLLYALMTMAGWTFSLRRQGEIRQIWSAFPDMPIPFTHLLHLGMEFRRLGLPAVLIAVDLAQAPSQKGLERFCAEKLRTVLTEVWSRGERQLHLVLLKSREEVLAEIERFEREKKATPFWEVVELPERGVEIALLLGRLWR